MRCIVYPYKMGSKSAGTLVKSIRQAGPSAFKVYPNRKYIPRKQDLIVNWGNSLLPDWALKHKIFYNQWLNSPTNVRIAANKLDTFNVFLAAGIAIPNFTVDTARALEWIKQGEQVVQRNLLTGTQGRGILLHNNLEQQDKINGGKVFVKYIKKKHEYRVHVFRGVVIDVQQKRKRQEIPAAEVDYQVRNHANGWVYCRENIDPPSAVCDYSVSAVHALGLDFGAVDVIWNEQQQKAFVLEVNCAPGLAGSTVDFYVNKIKEML